MENNKTIETSQEVEKQVQDIQKQLGINQSQFLSIEQVKQLHKQQEDNMLNDFVLNNTICNRYN